MKFTPDFLTENKIFFFDAERDFLFFFEDDFGVLIDENEEEIKFNWSINEDGYLHIKNNIINEIWKPKNSDEKEQYFIIEKIEKVNNKIQKKNKKIQFDYNNEIKRNSFSYALSLMKKDAKLKFYVFIFVLFLIIFGLSNLIYLIKDFNFLLKSFFIIVLLILGKDRILYFYIKYIKK